MNKTNSPWATNDNVKAAGPTPASKTDVDNYYETWRSAPTPQNAEPFLNALQPEIDKALQNFGGKDPDEYRTQAQLIALRAAENYDPQKGAGIRTHISNSLHKLTQVRQERMSVMHIPENVHAEKQHLQRKADEFKAEYDREPNLRELADLSGFSIRQIDRINRYGNSRTESSTESEKGDPMSQGRELKDMWLDYVYEELDPIDKKVYEWSTGYGGVEKIPKAEIAQRLKISAPAVSKRINKIVAKIEEGQELNA